MPDGMPAEGGAPAEGGGQDTAQVFNDVGNGLAVVTDAIMQSQAPDEIKGAMQKVLEDFIAITQALTGGGSAPQPGGVAPAEQQGQPFSQAGV